GKRRKRRNDKIELTPLENILNIYLSFMRMCKIGFKEVDEMELRLLLDLMIVNAKVNGKIEKEIYIEDLL
ncbi:MAG: hypothetical protein IJ728_00750, partial [Selenomonadaceae bacterium]|nr:hypothetical protein [Selenomonadaceae bacterium]